MIKKIIRYLINMIYSDRKLRSMAQLFFTNFPLIKAKLAGIRDSAYVPQKSLDERFIEGTSFYEVIKEEIESRKTRLLKKNNE